MDIPQRTEEWYYMRKKMLTSTDIASLLEENPYENVEDFYMRKFYEKDQESTESMKWGEYHEPLAKKFLQEYLMIQIHEVGLRKHKELSFLGASPDGYIIDKLGRTFLLEVKCPIKRNLQHIPNYIKIQIQIQLEVFEMEQCYLLQCNYEYDKKDFEKKPLLKEFKIDILQRDRAWFQSIKPKLLQFWEKLQKDKRRNICSSNYYITPYNFYGYLQNDPIIDYLEEYEYTNYTQDNDYYNTIYDKLFSCIEKHNIEYHKFDKICSKKNYHTMLQLIERKCPILFNGSIFSNGIYGTFSFLFHKSVLPLLKEFEIIGTCQEYCIVTITNRKIHTIQKIMNRLLTGKNLSLQIPKEYKSKRLQWKQMTQEDHHHYLKKLKLNLIYTYILDKTSKVYSTNVGLMNTRYIYIAPLEWNSICYDEIMRGISWGREVKEMGKCWKQHIEEYPMDKRLYPNMMIYNQKWNKRKYELAMKWGELTLVYYIGNKERKKLHENNIYSWKEHDSKTILRTLREEKEWLLRDKIQQAMIDINKQDTKLISYLPMKFPKKKKMFIDIETLYDKKMYVYMIGVGHYEEEWKYKYFLMNELHEKEQERMYKRFQEYMKQYKDACIYHWGNVEYYYLYPYASCEWIDLMRRLQESLFVMKNLWSYKLKEIANKMYEYNFISNVWNYKEKGSGEESIHLAWKCFQKAKRLQWNVNECTEFQKLKRYNNMDCYVLYEIVKYLESKESN